MKSVAISAAAVPHTVGYTEPGSRAHLEVCAGEGEVEHLEDLLLVTAASKHQYHHHQQQQQQKHQQREEMEEHQGLVDCSKQWPQCICWCATPAST
jgi:hypothetical protein